MEYDTQGTGFVAGKFVVVSFLSALDSVSNNPTSVARRS